MNKEIVKRVLSSLVILPLSLFFIIQDSILFLFFLLIIFFVTIYEWYQMTKSKPYLNYGIIFLLISFYSAYMLRNYENGLAIFLLIILICVSTDIGGYVFGKIFKGPKLTKISPNKTYSGVVGSFLLSIISYSIFKEYLSNFNLNKNIVFPMSIFDYIFIIIISAISQIGDLTISYFKRKSNIKNTGKLLPGHGGILDRIDGIVFVFPILYFLILLFNFK